jgi:anti-anti-sigma factor
VSVSIRSLQHGARFRVDVHAERDGVRVVPVGELDVATVGLLEAKLRELRDAAFSRIVLDLRQLDFLCTAGVQLIVLEDRLARRQLHDFRLIAGSPGVQRVLDLCGLLEQLEFCSDEAAAARVRRDSRQLAVVSRYLAQLRRQGRAGQLPR